MSNIDRKPLLIEKLLADQSLGLTAFEWQRDRLELIFFFVEIKLSLTASQPDLEAHRRMTVAEMGRLQGFKPGEVAWKQAATPITARGRQIGNCMSVPVLQEAIRAVLSAAGLM